MREELPSVAKQGTIKYNFSRISVLISAILGVIAVFSPLIDIPLSGKSSLIVFNKWLGIIFILNSLFSFFLIFKNRFSLFWISGFAQFFLTILLYFNIESKLQEYQKIINSYPESSGIIEKVINNTEYIYYTWILLITSSILLILAASLMAPLKKTRKI